MGTLTEGVIVYYSVDDGSFEDLLKRVHKEFPNECVVCLRPKGSFNIGNSEIDPRQKITLQRHNITRIAKNNQYINGLVRMTVGSSKQVEYGKFRNSGCERVEWEQGFSDISSGTKRSFDYGINLLDTKYVEGLNLEGLHDFRKYGGVLDKYFKPDIVAAHPKDHQGIMVTTAYYGSPGDGFVYHVEDGYFSSVNLLVDGEKWWTFPAERSNAVPSFEVLNDIAGDECEHPHNRKVYFCHPQKLMDRNINMKYILQQTGDIIYTLPLGPHSGVSITKTIAIARNCADEIDWKAVALHYGRKSRQCSDTCRSSFSGHISEIDVEHIVKYVTSEYEVEEHEQGRSKCYPLPFIGGDRAHPTLTSCDGGNAANFTCDCCRQEFSTKGNLKKHLQKFREERCIKHPMENRRKAPRNY